MGGGFLHGGFCPSNIPLDLQSLCCWGKRAISSTFYIGFFRNSALWETDKRDNNFPAAIVFSLATPPIPYQQSSI